ncbi:MULTISPECIES: hypothetical protein [Pseudomonas]|uniref:Uncharacterized protein n=1 Tax=Pseudomonas aphyarum TaxID=2942629 RepID=A0ABT5PQL6_9PSED|nr:hypothetical protein [Pseudomonas aphyarum]MDD0971213.1 hypothetical protein [Pseudomonas aphyarum]MDD1125821.1 hypothetical protein [Pseudomonas aphyarum]
MIKIRREQIEVLERAQQQAFGETVVEFFHQEHPVRCAQRGRRDVIHLVEKFTPRVVMHGISSQVEVVTVLETLLLSRLNLNSRFDAETIDAVFAKSGHTFDDLNDGLRAVLTFASEG